ncbi:M16 family metallopeptidase [Trichothermofontia sichuanensis]|uniref:M16 family metallopeptidase n=1 Tax=Trichothermofontia sichuanensis TaxID=3045816 RepID=UPI0036F3745A
MLTQRMPSSGRLYLPNQWQWRFVVSLLLVLLGSFCLASRPALAQSLKPEAVPSTVRSIQPYLNRVSRNITEFRLDNGLKFIVLENHQAPIISFVTYADVGGVDEPEGQTGVAHFLEHLAFKGTPKIGTEDYAAERPLLDQLDQLFDQIQAAKASGKTDRIKPLAQEFQALKAKAATYVRQNQFGQIVEQAGGVGLNAATSMDATRYFYSFPANKLELWMSLESERFLEPVFREFFEEKDVILEERRLRLENDPINRMLEELRAVAFQVHPYRRSLIGYQADIENLTRANVQDFFDTYYVPANLTIAIVGDVNPQTVKRMAQAYFGRYPAAPKPPLLDKVEPEQTEPRELSLTMSTQPWYFEAYHAPAMADRDYVIYELMGDLLSSGRTSRLYRTLVEQQQIALAARGAVGYPANKYPNLMLFYALSAPGHDLDTIAKALQQELERLKTEPVTANELERVKNQARASLLRSLDSTMGMASLLVDYEVKTGSWRNLFTEIDRIAAVTPADIQRVARQTFRPENRTVGRLLSESSPLNRLNHQ